MPLPGHGQPYGVTERGPLNPLRSRPGVHARSPAICLTSRVSLVQLVGAHCRARADCSGRHGWTFAISLSRVHVARCARVHAMRLGRTSAAQVVACSGCRPSALVWDEGLPPYPLPPLSCAILLLCGCTYVGGGCHAVHPEVASPAAGHHPVRGPVSDPHPSFHLRAAHPSQSLSGTRTRCCEARMLHARSWRCHRRRVGDCLQYRTQHPHCPPPK